MSLRHKWTEIQLREALAPALAGGEAKIHFETLIDAERFRFACYNLRRRKEIGTKLSFILNTIIEEDTITFEVLVKQTPVFELKRVTA